jgi:hypothetical protein
MPQITLPDGSSRQFDHSISVHDVAADIGAGLAKAALAGKVDGQLVDTSFLIEQDAEVAIITAKNDEALELIRHDAAHVMAHKSPLGPQSKMGFIMTSLEKSPLRLMISSPSRRACKKLSAAICPSREKSGKGKKPNARSRVSVKHSKLKSSKM